MSGYIGKTTNKDREVARAHTQSERDDLMGPMPGRVTAYYPDRGTVDVQPLLKKRKYDGSALEYPELKEVPIDWPRSGHGALTMPIPEGTRVTLTPQMRSMDAYDSEDDGGQGQEARSFNLSDMRASLAGGDPLTDPLSNVDPDATHLRFAAGGDYGIKGTPDGRIRIDGAEGDIYELTSDAVDLCAQGFEYLGTEATLDHMGDYATIGAQLRVIADKLAAMKKPE